MRVRTRIMIAAAGAGVTMALTAVVLMHTARQVEREMARNEIAGRIVGLVSSIRLLTFEYAIDAGDRVRTQWHLAHKSLEALLRGIDETGTAEERMIVARIVQAHEGLDRLFEQMVNVHSGRAGQSERVSIEDVVSSYRSQILNRTQGTVSDAFLLLEQTRREVAAIQRTAVVAVSGLFALLVAVLLAVLVQNVAGILRPIARMREGMARVGAGNLDHRLGVVAKDEIGDLARAFDEMTARLKATTLSRDELAGGANLITTAAAQILSVTTEVAASAAQTAASVSETSVTVQEVRQTADLSSEKARSVSENAQRVEEVSDSGREAVEEVVRGMGRIREQMDAVGASILRLSDQSQAIGEIVAAVNDLADQSNLLAVNAAIEAARAGEQGQGFAVVAQEVKSLSAQSKQATAQVRSILGEIQKAIGAAVLATEQGSKAVDAGVKQSEKAGEAIQTLAQSVALGAQAALQIAASSQQQLVGVNQVAAAMESIKHVSSQNVTGIHQAESAVQNLHELGVRLARLSSQGPAR